MSPKVSKQDRMTLEDLEIRFEDTCNDWDYYDLTNFRLVYEEILNNLPFNQVVINPTKLHLFVFYSSIIPMILLERDINEANTNILSYLNHGDLVRFNGCYGKFKEVVEQPSGKNLIIIDFLDMIESLPVEQAWKLSKYEGKRTTISRYIYKKPIDKKHQHNLLKRLFQLDTSELPQVLRSKTVIVSDKQNFFDLYPKSFIEQISLTDLFPCGYFKNKHDPIRIGYDSLQRKPVLCCVSNLEIAYELIKNDSKIEIIIIHGLRKLKGNIIFLKKIQDLGLSILILLDSSEYDWESINELSSMSFRFHIWRKSNLSVLDKKNRSFSFKNCFLLKNNLLQTMVNFKKTILNADYLSDIIESLFQSVNTLRKLPFENEYKEEFIRIAYSAISYYRFIPFINEKDIVLYDNIWQQLDGLRFNLMIFVNQDGRDIINEICFGIDNLSHQPVHPKNEIFVKVLKYFTRTDCIVVTNNWYRNRIKDEFENMLDKHFNVITISELMRSNTVYRKALFTGWFKDISKLELTGLVEECILILFPFESNSLKWVEKKLHNSLNQLSKNQEETPDFEPVIQTEKPDRFTDLDDFINRLIFKSYYASVVQKEQVSIIPAFFVEFEEDVVAFLTEAYSCRCLNYEMDDIVKTKFNNLKIGDKLVFVKDSNEDIFEKAVNLIESESPINEFIEKSDMWRKALLDWQKTGSYSVKDIATFINQYGIKRTETTIRNWLTDKTLGPEDEAIRTIAHLTKDPLLQSELETVIEACKKRRALHVKIGRYLAASIVAAVIEQQSYEDNITLQITDDLSNYSKVVTLKTISDEKFEVPNNRVNRLLDKI